MLTPVKVVEPDVFVKPAVPAKTVPILLFPVVVNESPLNVPPVNVEPLSPTIWAVCVVPVNVKLLLLLTVKLLSVLPNVPLPETVTSPPLITVLPL